MRFNRLLNKKTYYYILKSSAKSYDAELLRNCPGCGGDWHQEQPLHDIFDFMCERCGLLSNIAFNVR
ncbi:MAG: DUF2310 family Zn-ribbon-containing protein [Alphaproteobacteria bacterium]|nr:DUF2310 family Zn-ribbon-containing protein [Alphaproteobacteria bacterium]